MDDVGNELNVMRRELQKLMGVINMKDQEISTLNTQLKSSKQEINHRYRRLIKDFIHHTFICVKYAYKIFHIGGAGRSGGGGKPVQAPQLSGDRRLRGGDRRNTGRRIC